MTQNEALALLPADAKWSCSFGNAGEGAFVEHYRTPDGYRWIVSNGNSYLGFAPFNWSCRKETI